MKYIAILVALMLAGCDVESKSSYAYISYEDLLVYPTDCARATEQQDFLKAVQRQRNFADDPDELNEDDRAYNSRLKATIWWYEYKCRSPK